MNVVDSIRSYYEPTCQDIADKAYKSHSTCYREPFSGPSVCDLCKMESDNDFFIIFWTMKSNIADPQMYKNSIDVLFKEGWACTNRSGYDCLKTAGSLAKQVAAAVRYTLRFVKIGISVIPTSSNGSIEKRAIDSLTSYEMAGAIALSMGWNASVLDWYVFVESVGGITDSLDFKTINIINVVIAVRDAFVMTGVVNLNIENIKIGMQVLSDTITKVVSAVTEGSLVL